MTIMLCISILEQSFLAKNSELSCILYYIMIQIDTYLNQQIQILQKIYIIVLCHDKISDIVVCQKEND